jgi:hypothetical protein
VASAKLGEFQFRDRIFVHEPTEAPICTIVQLREPSASLFNCLNFVFNDAATFHSFSEKLGFSLRSGKTVF